MMNICPEDFEALRCGEPPRSEALLKAMTVGRELWLEHIRGHYLEGYIDRSGSKVKVLVGAAGTGKTHLVRSVLLDAKTLGYETVYLSALQHKLNDLPGLYQALVAQLDLEKLVDGLCARIVEKFGFSGAQYDKKKYFLQLLYEEQALPRERATVEIRRAAQEVFRDVDFGPSFRAFAYNVVNSRLILGKEGDIQIGLRWLAGEKLDRHEKQATQLFERLQKTTARYWLNSLICLLRVAGIRGLVVAIDDLEVLAERDPQTRRYYYSANAAKDVCELFRQLIDDVELLSHFLLLLAGRDEMILNDKRGFMSYEALWMRLQTGLVSRSFNPHADTINTVMHLKQSAQDFPEQVYSRLQQLFGAAGVPVEYGGLPDLSEHYPLRARVMEAAQMARLDGDDGQ